MKRLLRGVLWGIGGYVVGAVGGGVLIAQLSSNTHDLSVEAAMTGAFVIGPLAGLIGLIAGVVRRGGER